MEKLENSQNRPFSINLDHFSWKILESWKTAKIGHSQSIWITSVEQIRIVGKYLKLAIAESHLDHFSRKILEKLQNGQNWPF